MEFEELGVDIDIKVASFHFPSSYRAPTPVTEPEPDLVEDRVITSVLMYVPN